MEYVFIKKEILADSELDQYAIGAYIALRMIYLQDKAIRYVSINELCYELYGNTEFTRYTKANVVAGLKQLITAGVVVQIDELGKSEFVLDLSKLHINSAKGTSDYYVVITVDEIRKIFNHVGREDKFSLLRYFVNLIGSISYTTTIKDIRGADGYINNFVGFMTQTYLSNISYISESSGIAYTSILEELQLVYVYRHTELKWDTTNNQISSIVNKYGRYENREMIKRFAENYESFSNVETVKKMQKKKDTNYRRSLMQKYRCLYNGHPYDIATQRQIYAYVHLKNQELLQKMEKTNSEEQRKYYETQLNDESVFDEIIINK